MLEVMLKGSERVLKGLQKEKEKSEKALAKSIRIQAFRLRKQLVQEIEAGAPGGRRFRMLSYLGQYTLRRRTPRDKALMRLAKSVRVHIEKPYRVRLGWVGPQVSKSWKRLAKMHQEGFTTEVTAVHPPCGRGGPG